MDRDTSKMQGDTLAGRIASLALRYDLLAVYVFGSRAAETAERVCSGYPAPPAATMGDSDVDIGVQPDWRRRLSASERVELMQALEDELGVPRADLVILPEADPFLAAEVVRGELLYARDEIEESELQLYYLRRAGDLAPFFRERWRELMRAES
nr:nucleotidyltransferase domain-containing protein [Actinomycetales bacterium]